MPTSVDTRVVEMRFDNKKFEKNSEETMKSIENLDKSLDNLGDSAKSFTQIQNAAERVDLSKLQSAAEAVTNKFSALGVITDQVLRNITTSVSNAVTGMIKQFTVAPITAGFDKYAAKTEAVQTIMHATHEDIDTVNKSLVKLSEYTDETSYSFSDMVSSISKFTGAGLKLEDAETAVEGIANWAATAGVGTTEASRAFYNISQAMSSGALRVQDWSSIEGLNMNTVEFEQAAIDAAQAMIDEGRASQEMQAAFKKASPSVEGFRDTLSSGWLTKDVMTEVFKVYADTSTDFGLAAYKAAQEAKTFKDVVEATAEAVGSGWSNVFEQIFGNYEEARVLWTNVANELYEVFTAPTTWLTDILTEWHKAGGYVDFVESIYDMWAAIKSIVQSIVGVIGEVFPVDMVEVLTQATAKLREFAGTMRSYFAIEELPEIIDATRTAFDAEAGTLGEVDKAAARARQSQKELNKESEKNLNPIVETFRGLFSIFKAVTSVSGGLLKILLPTVKLLVPIANLVTAITGKLGSLVAAIVDAIFESKAFKDTIDFLAGITDGIVGFIDKIINKVAEFIKGFTDIPAVQQFIKTLSEMREEFQELAGPYIDKIKEFFETFLKDLEGFDASGVLNGLLTVLGGIVAIAAEIGKALIAVWGFIEPYWNKLVTFIEKSVTKVKDYIKNDIVPMGWFQWLIKASGFVVSRVRSTFESLVKYVQNGGLIGVFSWLRDQLFLIFNSLNRLNLDDLLSRISGLGIAGGIITLLITIKKAGDMMSSIKKFFKALADIPDSLEGFTKAAKGFSKGLGIKRFAVAVLMLTAALYILSQIPKDDLITAGQALLQVVLVLVVAFGGLALLTAALEKLNSNNAAAMGKAVIIIIALCGAVILITSALKKMSDIAEAGHLESSITGLIIVLLVLAGSVTLLSLVGKGLDGLAKSILLIAISAAILVGAYLLLRPLLQDLSTGEISKQLGVVAIGLAIVVAALAILSVVMKNSAKDIGASSLAMIALAASMLIMVFAFKKLSDLSWDGIGRGVVAMIAIIGSLVAITAISNKMLYNAGKDTASIALALILFSVAMAAMIKVIKRLNKIPIRTLGSGLLKFVAVIGVMALAMSAAGKMNPKSNYKSILAMAAVMLSIVVSLALLSKFKLSSLIKSTIFLGLALVSFGLAMKLAGKAMDGTWQTGVMLAALILSLTAALMLLTILNPEKLMPAMAVLAATLISFGISMALASTVLDKVQWRHIIGAVLLIAAVATALYFLAQEPVIDVANSAGAIKKVLTALRKSLKAMGEVTSNMKDSGKTTLAKWAIATISMIVMLYAVIGALIWLSTAVNDTSKLTSISLGLSILLPALGTMVQRAGSMGSVGVNPAALLGTFFTIIVIFLAIGTVIGILIGVSALLNQSEFVKNALVEAKEFLGLLGETLGAFVSGLLGGAVEKAMTQLPHIMELMGQFIDQMGELFTKLSGFEIKTENIDALGSLAMVMLKLTGAELLDAISQLIGIKAGGEAGSDFKNFADSLVILAEGVTNYCSALGENVDPEKIEASAKAISSLSDVAKSLPRQGGWLQKLIGTPKDLGTFATELSTAAPEIEKYANVADGIANKESAIIASARAIQAMVDVANTIKPKTEVDWPGFTYSTQSLASFAAQLNIAGPSIKTYGEKVTGINTEAILSSAVAIGALVTVANAIKPNESINWGVYKRDTQDLGEFLGTLTTSDSNGHEYSVGQNLARFSRSVEDVDATQLLRIAGVISALVKVAENIHTVTTTGIFGTGSEDKTNDLARFLSDLAGVGPSLVSFVTSFSDDTLLRMDRIREVISGFTSIGESLAADPNVAAHIYDFAGGLNTAAGSFVEASGTFGLINFEALDEMINNLKGNTDLFDKIKEAASSVVDAFNTRAVDYTTEKKNSIAQSIAGALADALRSKRSLFVGVGSSMVDGVVQGINDVMWKLYDAGSTLTQNVIDRIKQILQIHSPSRVMTNLGALAGEGFANGLASCAKDSGAAGASLANSLTDSIRAVIDYIQAILNGDLVVDMTIRPVMDLTNVQGGANAINSMLSARRAVLANVDTSLGGSKNEVTELVDVCWKILGEIQNGSDIYIDDDVLAGRINRRLARP